MLEFPHDALQRKFSTDFIGENTYLYVNDIRFFCILEIHVKPVPTPIT